MILLVLLGQASTLVPPPIITPAPPLFLAAPIPPELFARPVSPRPIAPGKIIGDRDYPTVALQLRQEGVVAFALRVDAAGRPSGCQLIESSGSTALDHATCRLMLERARFVPARDGAGRAVEGAWRSRVKWAIPPGTPRTTAAPSRPLYDQQVMRFRLTTDGRMRDCAGERRFAGRTERRSEPDCTSERLAPAMTAALQAHAPGRELRVRLEQRLVKQASQPWPTLAGRGELLVASSLGRVVVGPGGRVTECMLVDSKPLGDQPLNFCRPGLFVVPTGLTLPTEMRVTSSVVVEAAVGKSQ